ncbi:ABC transporter [Salmonella enterica]|nr:FtsX-like permease family protein [Salmonella enterica]EAT1014596.1 FtsX-like permease family protein [Salmonella enterica]EBN0646558.1 ABC transporter [Salmonella enterica]EFO5648731.1 FtsX-like permease family protein [Salmonella enterica subsp. enterica serovar Miami]ELM2646018.1 ABC transporter permease [Salmonella enterica]
MLNVARDIFGFFLFNFLIVRQSLAMHKIRVLLTVICIGFGGATVIIMEGLGNQTQKNIMNSVASLGSNIISIKFTPKESSNGYYNGEFLSYNELQYLARSVNVKHISPYIIKSAYVTYMNHSLSAQVMGANNQIFRIRNMSLYVGDFFNENHGNNSSNTVVLGYSLAKSLFGKADYAVNNLVRINGSSMRVTGVIASKGDGLGIAVDDMVFTPLNSFNIRLFGYSLPSGVLIESKNSNAIKDITRDIVNVLDKKNTSFEYKIRTTDEILRTLSKTQSNINLFLLFVSFLSLFMAGVNVMNILLANLNQRQFEVGLRMALGARYSDVFFQFLSESILISVLGAFLGLFFSLISFYILDVNSIHVSISLGRVSVIMLIITSVTVCFGLYPAHLAAKMKPIDCLRSL